MGSKKKTDTGSSVTPEPPVPPQLCGAWAFVLGASFGAFCRLSPGHEGDHRTEIKVYAEPQSRFSIAWTLGNPDS